jgi:hypothetical protein
MTFYNSESVREVWDFSKQFGAKNKSCCHNGTWRTAQLRVSCHPTRQVSSSALPMRNLRLDQRYSSVLISVFVAILITCYLSWLSPELIASVLVAMP